MNKLSKLLTGIVAGPYWETLHAGNTWTMNTGRLCGDSTVFITVEYYVCQYGLSYRQEFLPEANYITVLPHC